MLKFSFQLGLHESVSLDRIFIFYQIWSDFLVITAPTSNYFKLSFHYLFNNNCITGYKENMFQLHASPEIINQN